uniref:Secreted protein n=1 Tax=Mesocestoides corti TaxID=53468 RepID=A0A5K3FZM7_MESCO
MPKVFPNKRPTCIKFAQVFVASFSVYCIDIYGNGNLSRLDQTSIDRNHSRNYCSTHCVDFPAQLPRISFQRRI